MLIERLGLAWDALAGKVAMVTGAGRGIGKELARALAWLGAEVVIAEIAETGAAVEALIRSEGGTARFIRTDVSDEGSVRRLADYFRRTQKDVEAFIRDPEALSAAQEALASREKTVRTLLAEL